MSNIGRIGILSVGNVPMGGNGIGPFILKIPEWRYTPANAVLSGRCVGEVCGVGVLPDAAELDCETGSKARAAGTPAVSAIPAVLIRLRAQPGLRERALRPSIWWRDNVSSGDREEEDYVPGYSG